jgi:hypothetical protein
MLRGGEAASEKEAFFQLRRRLSPAQKKHIDDQLLQAVAYSREAVIGALLDQGANPNARYAASTAVAGMTAAMLCAQKMVTRQQGVPELGYGRMLSVCDPHAKDNEGLTPLMHAAAEGREEAVEILSPRSDVLATCGDMGEDFDEGWCALFFLVNVNHKLSTLADRARFKRMSEMLSTPAIWALKSREGLDVLGVERRCGGCPERQSILINMRGRDLAWMESSAIEGSLDKNSAFSGGSEKRLGRPAL